MSRLDEAVAELLDQAVAERLPFDGFMDRLTVLVATRFPGISYEVALRAAAVAAAQRLPKVPSLAGLWSGYNAAIKVL